MINFYTIFLDLIYKRLIIHYVYYINKIYFICMFLKKYFIYGRSLELRTYIYKCVCVCVCDKMNKFPSYHRIKSTQMILRSLLLSTLIVPIVELGRPSLGSSSLLTTLSEPVYEQIARRNSYLFFLSFFFSFFFVLCLTKVGKRDG